MEPLLLTFLLPYLISLAANERTAAIHQKREEKFTSALRRREELDEARLATRSLRDDLRSACVEIARHKFELGVTPEEEPLWQLLSDDLFQADLAEWLMAGGIAEGEFAKTRLLQHLEQALLQGGAKPQRVELLKSEWISTIDKTVFSNPVLARWRHQKSLDYLREQVTKLRELTERLAGIYSEQSKETALAEYRAKALKEWDIIDLGNLPEGDVHMATQQRLLRQLYIPVRISTEFAIGTPEFTSDPRQLPMGGREQAVGECLAETGRWVFLGDPGGGKTTLLRWLATAYLLRHNQDQAFESLPDTKSLPTNSWLPILIRCRSLGATDLSRSFIDFLKQHLQKMEISPTTADIMHTVILERIAKGDALLLVDGLDEVSDAQTRVLFCQELERTAARYPEAPIVVTSRIVGYRDMPYRMGASFTHGTIAELRDQDQDHFARRWIAVTEHHLPLEEQNKRTKELIDSLHSSDRIERLASNPMLLTTLALIKRKVGKLPNRRTKLYQEAVGVLLNWNPLVYDTIDDDEAIPQLEFIAYELCRLGIQRITEGALLDLLDRVRHDYAHIRAIRRRSSETFLHLLEMRSSILIKVGSIWAGSGESAIWEFRHLTFQEYLAARAMIDGRFPDRDKTLPLAEHVKHWARPKTDDASGSFGVREPWHEILRLLVAECRDDDVNDVMLTILTPDPSEDPESARARIVFAMHCLTDDPNIDNDLAERAVKEFAELAARGEVDLGEEGALYDVVIQIARGFWGPVLLAPLLEGYCRIQVDRRTDLGAALSEIFFEKWWSDRESDSEIYLLQGLESTDRLTRISTALSIMHFSYSRYDSRHGEAIITPRVIRALLALIEADWPDAMAASWALTWLCNGFSFLSMDLHAPWKVSEDEIHILAKVLHKVPPQEVDLKRFLMYIIATTMTTFPEIATLALSPFLEDESFTCRRIASQAVALQSPPKIARLLQGVAPAEPITRTELALLAQKIRRTEVETRALLERVSKEFELKLEWDLND